MTNNPPPAAPQLKKAIMLPSGDQTGDPSGSGLLVSWRCSEPSAFMTKISEFGASMKTTSSSIMTDGVASATAVAVGSGSDEAVGAVVLVAGTVAAGLAGCSTVDVAALVGLDITATVDGVDAPD